MADMGLEFECVPSNLEERLDNTRPAEEVAKELALGKARDVAVDHPDALVVGSDTVVAFDGRQLGKQPDEQTARELLHQLSGQKIEVITGVALVCAEHRLELADFARGCVIYESYGEAEVESFLASGEWQDKAGTVAVQSPHTPPIAQIEGEYNAVLGLSTEVLRQLMKQAQASQAASAI